MLENIKERITEGSATNNILSKNNILFLIVIFLLMIIFCPTNKLDWFGVFLTMFSTMSNDSVQTLGTFITSNSKKSWLKMWLYISILFIATLLFAWFYNMHRLDFDKLVLIPYHNGNDFMHYIPPILLIILTYYKIPVSSTFLILSVFASQRAISVVLLKTLIGYTIGFAISYLLWKIILKFFKILLSNEGTEKRLRIWKRLQWLSTGVLWVSWLTNNTSNIVVYLPREFSIHDLILFLILGIFFIGFTFYNHGGPIQKIVSEKKDITNKRSTSIINFSFAFVILILNRVSHAPMATTWVFIGILAGRELCIAQLESDGVLTLKERYKNARKLIFKDLILAGLGIAISLTFAMINNFYIK